MKMIKLALVALFCLPLLAQAETVIAVVDPMQALMEADEVKQRNAELEEAIERDGMRLRELRNQIGQIEGRLQREGMTMSTEERNRLADERDSKGLEFQSLQQRVKRRVDSDRQALLEDMEPKLLRAVEAVVEEKDIDVVLNAQAVVFAKPDMDITEEITKRLNEGG